MELFNRLFSFSLIHRVLILLTLILSGPEAVAPQFQTDEIVQKTLADLLTEIDRPTVEAPARNIGKRPKFQFVFLPAQVSLFTEKIVSEKHSQFSSVLKNHFLISTRARSPPIA